MKFNILVKKILAEAGSVDPRRVGYQGTPAGFRKTASGAVENPTMMTKKADGLADTGAGIAYESRKMLALALGVVMTDNAAGMELKRLLTQHGNLRFQYTNALQEVRALEGKLDRMGNRAEEADKIKQRAQEYKTIAIAHKRKLDEFEPAALEKLKAIFKTGTQNFVKTLQDKPQYHLKSLNDLDKIVVQREGSDKILEFLKQIYNGESFKPLADFIDLAKKDDKDPLFNLSTVYKTVADSMVKGSMVGSAERVFNHMVGRGQNVRAIAEPTAGRKNLQQKDINLANAVAAIKKQNPERAKQAIAASSSPNKEKILAVLGTWEKGGATEADVIRAIYQS